MLLYKSYMTLGSLMKSRGCHLYPSKRGWALFPASHRPNQLKISIRSAFKSFLSPEPLLFIMDSPLNTVKTAHSFQFSTDSEPLSSEVIKQAQEKPLKTKNHQLKPRNVGHWNPHQKELYYVFLQAHKENFVKKELRRTDKIFKEMAKFILTRAADQCRSHHQKMEKKYSTIENILESLKQSSSVQGCLEAFKTVQNPWTENMDALVPLIRESAEASKPTTQTSEEVADQSPLRSYEAIEELELGINATGLFSDEAFSIDNYFLI